MRQRKNIHHGRNENQYYAEAFEIAVCRYLRVDRLSDLEFPSISSDDMLDIFDDAKTIAGIIHHTYGNGNYVYTGRSTNSQLGDITTPDGATIELKYINGRSSGTYQNTSISYFETLGFQSYQSFLLKHGYYNFLRNILPGSIVPNESNSSPVTMQESRVIRHAYPNVAKKIASFEQQIRKQYVHAIGDTIVSRNLVSRIADDMLEKRKTSDGTNKGTPDTIIIYDYQNDKYRIITSAELSNACHNSTTVTYNGTALVIGGIIRLQVGWQNGNGLNNPTIRVFLRI